MSRTYGSWGRLPGPPNGRRAQEFDGTFANRAPSQTMLPHGNGRSYGDSCLNDNGWLLDMRSDARIRSFDASKGLIEADAGVLLRDITETTAPEGWFLPVTPGTQFVTLGGALANDVHGKNHHRRGTFGRWVESFELVRSDRGRLRCSPEENADLFAATIAGMGLTGVVTSVRLRLMAVPSSAIQETTLRFDRLEQYFEAAEAADERHEYAVAWIDSLASGRKFGRGHLICGDHAPEGERAGTARAPLASVPFTPPISPLRGVPLKAFNEMYFRKAKAGETKRNVSFDAFFYPLDRIEGWNKLYGPKGLHQHQSRVPLLNAFDTIGELMETARRHGQGSFLTVLKRFGALRSPGILSFPREGYTLTLDFPHRGERTHRLLEELDAIVRRCGGAVNPYKDSRMSPETFETSFPSWRELEMQRDPAIMSDFWRRTAMRLPKSARSPSADRRQSFVDATAETLGTASHH